MSIATVDWICGNGYPASWADSGGVGSFDAKLLISLRNRKGATHGSNAWKHDPSKTLLKLHSVSMTLSRKSVLADNWNLFFCQVADLDATGVSIGHTCFCPTVAGAGVANAQRDRVFLNPPLLGMDNGDSSHGFTTVVPDLPIVVAGTAIKDLKGNDVFVEPGDWLLCALPQGTVTGKILDSSGSIEYELVAA